MSDSKQVLEIAVPGTDKKGAEQELRAIGIVVVGATYTELEQLTVVRLEKKEVLADRFYEKLYGSDKLSIISDSVSRSRTQKIFENIYKLETHLRKLLLYIPDTTGAYLSVITEKAVHYSSEPKIAVKGSLDPITSHLTMGQMLEVFQQNMALKITDAVTWGDLLKMVSGVENIEQLKTKLSERTEEALVWNIIADQVLKDRLELEELSDAFNYIKGIRDKAAHHRIVTKDEESQVQYRVKDLISRLKIKTLGAREREAVRVADKAASNALKNKNGGYPDMWAIPPRDTVVDSWGFYNRESVSYAAWKVYQTTGHMFYWGGHGNANQWPSNALKKGLEVSSNPRSNSVAISTAGFYGHAMWVEEVYGNGTIRISQYNHDWKGGYSETTLSSKGLTYIYF